MSFWYPTYWWYYTAVPDANTTAVEDRLGVAIQERIQA